MNSSGRFIAILAVVVMVAIIPLQYAAQGQEDILHGAVDTISAEFADRVRHQGYITVEMYGDYLKALGQTGDSYDIGLEIAHPVTGSEVAGKETGEKTPAILAKHAPAAGMSVHTTELLSSGTHVHTDDCYEGHKHTTKSTYTHYHAHGYNCQYWTTYRYWMGVCAYCGTEYCWQAQFWQSNQPTGGWHGGCSNCGREGSRVPGKDRIITDYIWTCGYNMDANGDGVYDNVPKDVVYAYLGNVLPQSFKGGTLIDGCHSYHQCVWSGSANSFESGGYVYANISHYDPTYYVDLGWINPPAERYFNNIFSWAAEMQSRYGGEICSAPAQFSISIKPGDYDYQMNGRNIGITLQFFTEVVNSKPVFRCKIMLSEDVYGWNGYYWTGLIARNYYEADTSKGDFIKPYFTLSEVAAMYNQDLLVYFDGLLANRNSAFAKALWYCRKPYTSTALEWQGSGDYWYQVTVYKYTEGQPVLGYLRTETFNRTGYCYGGVNTHSYADGTSNRWNFRCDLADDTTPDCDRVVTGITPTHPVQTVYKGEPIATTATATMMDGSVKTVSCTASGFDSNNVGTQAVTLTYYGLVGNAKTTGTRSCGVTVTVKSRKTLTGITVSPASQEVQRYTDPAFTVTASYSDGTSSQVLGFNVLGFDGAKLGEQTVTLSYTEDGVGRTATASVTVCRLTAVCPVCGTVYELDDDDVDRGCPTCSGEIVAISASPEEVTVRKGEQLPITVTAYYRDGRTGILSGWDSNYDPEKTGLQDVTVTYDGFSAHVMATVSSGKTCPVCGNIYFLDPDGTDPGCSVCYSEVFSISAAPEDMTVERYGELPITVTATFKDGHTEEVGGWGTDFTADTTGEFDVPIYYKSAVTSVHVTVLEEGLVTCPYCHTAYSRHEYPKGCPLCSRTLAGIEAQLRNGGNRVIYRSDLNLQVILIYRDTHREITYTGFTYTGFDSSVLGVQTVTVTYGEFTTALTVEVVDTLDIVTCPVCGSQYYLNEGGADPGCPYCSGEEDEERAVFYFDTVYTDGILKKLMEDGVYHLQDGDYFTLTVNVTRDSARARITQLFRGRKAEDKRKEGRTYGGEVII